MNEGITSQFGFLFQKYAFIDIVINNASMNVYFTYEGADDIDLAHANTSDPLVMTCISNSNYIQVKSGNVSKDCWAKVVGNWLLLENYNIADFMLLCENEMNFDIKSDEIVDAVCDYFVAGKGKSRKSIARRVYDKFFEKSNDVVVKDIVIELIDKCTVIVKTIDEIKKDILEIFIKNYCTDIKIYEKAKEKRFERFIEYIVTGIDKSIENKKRFTVTFSNLMSIVSRVCNEISDNKYIIDVTEIKKRKRKDAENIIENSDIREVRQLLKVKNNIGFVTKELVKELLYKDFREVYAEGDIEISNIEDTAHTNYEDAIFELDDSPTAKDVFLKTTSKSIGSNLMENSSTYRNGCYVYLTGDGIDPDLQISWGDEEDE